MTNQVRLSPQDMQRLSTLLFRMSHDPKTRADTARVMARIDPQAAKSFADVHLDDKLAAFRKEIEDGKLQDRIKLAQGAQKAQRAKLAENYTEEQIVEIEKTVMTPLGLSDYNAASKIYAADNPPIRPEFIPPSEREDMRTTWEFPTVTGKDGKTLSFADFVKDPVKASHSALEREIGAIMQRHQPSPYSPLAPRSYAAAR